MTKKFVALSIIIYSGLIFFTFPSYALQNPKENIRTEARIKLSYGKLPLSFIENKGQVDKSVYYYLKGKQGSIYFTKEAIVYDLFFNNELDPKEKSSDCPLSQENLETLKRLSFSLKPAGANRKSKLVSKTILPGRLNYLIGNDPKKWHADIPIYEEIIYRDLYNGIDLKIYGTNSRMEYDFIVSPGADPNDIAIKCEGINGLKIDEKGDLLIETSLGNIRHLKPLIYQKIKGERHTVDGSFRLSKNTFSFDIKNYNKDYPLIIDPLTMTYSTYLGGGGWDQGDSIAVDSTGNAYVTGFTASDNFPTKNSYEDTFPGNPSVFVTKINHGGDSLIYSTYLGGSGTERGWDVVVDSTGSAYITGQTDSDNFPTKNPYQPEISGETDIFITKLTPSGNDLSFSTYLGGDLFETGKSIAVDSSGNVYITGNTDSTNFPTVNAYQSALEGSDEDAFIAKFSPAGNNLLFSTYIGGSSNDMPEGIAIDANGNSYITGYTLSTDFPVKNAYQAEYSGNVDAFITKLGPSGDSISYSTFLGGKEGNDIAHGIEVDQEGSAYIVGETNSTGFPTENAYQPVLSGNIDAFITKLNPAGNTIAYSTYLGGAFGDEYGYAIAVDGKGCVYISGATDSTGFPVKNAFQGLAGKNKNAFITKMNPDGETLAFSTYIGGATNEQIAYGIAVDSSESVYVTGMTTSTDFPTNSAFQEIYGGIEDAFIARFDMREKYIWYVDGNVVTSGDGRSWVGAFKTIQEAFAVKAASGGDEIWVKKGTYGLSSPIFVPIDVGIYGGFAGSETQRDQRDWSRNITKIDGQNSVYHCFYIVAGATIDGFTITGGNANGEGESGNDSGGGFYITQSAPTIANCSIIDNSAVGGGGMFNFFNSSPVITNCTIAGNSSSYGGGGIFNESYSVPIITNSIIKGNSAEIAGGGIWNSSYSSPVITNCTIAGNIAESGAGGIWNQNNSYPDITNSIIWGNTAPVGHQMYSDESSVPVVTYCDFQGGYTGEGNIDSDPLFVSGEDYHLQESSPCIDKGNNSTPELPDTDFDGNSRIIDGDGDGTATVDMGADEFISSIADGDVAPLGNRDGIVNVGDALVALRFALGLETPTEEDKKHGDVAPLDAQGKPNPDGQINVGDALVILRIALGIISLGY